MAKKLVFRQVETKINDQNFGNSMTNFLVFRQVETKINDQNFGNSMAKKLVTTNQ